VRRGHPFEACSEIPLHALHQIAGQLRQVHPVTELGRHDQLPHAFIPDGLPLAETIRDIDATFRSIESGLGGAALAGSLTGDIASVGPPLCAGAILRVRDPHGTADCKDEMELGVGTEAYAAGRAFLVRSEE
jgi:hypothetical protein